LRRGLFKNLARPEPQVGGFGNLLVERGRNVDAPEELRDKDFANFAFVNDVQRAIVTHEESATTQEIITEAAPWSNGIFQMLTRRGVS
jgi:hypothetical protein